MRISRGGAVLDDRTAPPQAGWFAHLSSDVVLAPGDRVEIFYPASAALPSRDYTWDGLPAIDSCAVGSTTVGGVQGVGPHTVYPHDRPGTFIQSVHVQRPDPMSHSKVATVTQSGASWTGAFHEPLLPGDVIDFTAHFNVDPSFGLMRHSETVAGTCATDPPFVAEPPAPLPASDGALRRLQKRDVVQRASTVRVRVGCEAASRIRCRGRAVLARSGRTVRARRLSVAPGRSSLVKLRLTKRVARQLERRKRLEARIVATSRDAAGKRLATSRALTLEQR